jgi:hypothetical protein
VDHLIEYLEFKLAKTGMMYEVPRCEPRLANITKPEDGEHG